MRKRLTRKRLTMLVLTGLLVLGLAASASAWFGTSADSTVKGKTGLVSITTCNVQLTKFFQPGDTQYAKIKVHNNGNCPLEIVRIQIIGKPWFLAVSVTGPLNQSFKPCNTKTFTMYVKMPQGYTSPQNQFFTFKVRFYALNTPTNWGTIPAP